MKTRFMFYRLRRKLAEVIFSRVFIVLTHREQQLSWAQSKVRDICSTLGSPPPDSELWGVSLDLSVLDEGLNYADELDPDFR